MKLQRFARSRDRLGLTLLLGLIQLAASAQLLTNNGAAITIKSGGVVLVNGNISNKAGSSISNSGIIQVTGDLTSAGTLAGGTFILKGFQNQLLDAVANTSIANLQISNNGFTVSVPHNLTVTSLLTVGSGMVLTDPAATITLPDGAAILSEGNGHYVRGNLEIIRNGTNGSVDFGHGVVLDGSGQGLGTVSIVRTAGLLTPDVSFGQNFANTSYKGIDRIWTIEPASQPTGPGPVPLTFSWLSNDDHGISDFSQSRIWEQTVPGQPWAIRSAVADASGRSISASFTTLKRFTVSNAANPLPVELTRFTAERQGNNGWLRWATASEKNNDHFVVESSTDGLTFRQLGQVTGHGTSVQPQEYSYTDANLARYAAGVVYYRLHQVDKDGAESFSPVRSVGVPMSGFAVAPLPNPLRNAEALSLQVRTAEAGPATLLVTDALGRALLKKVLTLTTETNSLALPEAAQWPQGVYLLRVQQGTQHQSVKLVRE
jgi:hypothetical protein